MWTSLAGQSRFLWVLVLLLILSGCVHPKVTYKTNPEADSEGKIKFRLVATRVVLGETNPDPKDGKLTYININTNKLVVPSEVSALQVPREDDTALYAIIPQSQWLWMVETKLSVNYFDNTRLVKKIGTEVEDSRVKVIQAIGSFVGALAAVAITPPVEDKVNIRIPVALDVEPEQAWKELPSNPGWEYSVAPKSVKEVDAVDRDTYFHNYKDGLFSIFSSTRTVPISSCRQSYLKIRVKGSTEEKVNLPIQVADYKNIRTYEMPDKGSISSHTLCGADIATEKSEVASGFEILAEMVKQAKTIKEAQEK